MANFEHVAAGVYKVTEERMNGLDEPKSIFLTVDEIEELQKLVEDN